MSALPQEASPRARSHNACREPFEWAGYAASAWAIAYAIGVRGYQGLGGTVGLPGSFEDPEAMRRASLIAAALLVAVGIGCLAFVRPWGLRLPRRPLIALGLIGAAYAAAHALTAYLTKPFHLVGLIDLRFRGWERVDEDELIAWDLLFYEPWFLGLGVLVTLAALHHHYRTGGSATWARRFVIATAAATIFITAVSVTELVATGG